MEPGVGHVYWQRDYWEVLLFWYYSIKRQWYTYVGPNRNPPKTTEAKGAASKGEVVVRPKHPGLKNDKDCWLACMESMISDKPESTPGCGHSPSLGPKGFAKDVLPCEDCAYKAACKWLATSLAIQQYQGIPTLGSNLGMLVVDWDQLWANGMLA